MARFKVPAGNDQIHVFDGVEGRVYKVKDGVVEVSDEHDQAIVAGVPGSQRIEPEAPAKPARPGSPAKENE